MKKIYFLFLVALVLSSCKTLNESELLGKKPECLNKICDKMERNITEKETNIDSAYNYYRDTRKLATPSIDKSKDYLLDIKYTINKKENLTTFTTALSLGILPLLGFPDYVERSVDIEATLKTKAGFPIKTYREKGPVKGNYAAIIYGYNINDAATASAIESLGDATRSLYHKISLDDKIYAEAEKIRKEEEKDIKKLKNIVDGHNFYKRKILGLEKGDITYLEPYIGPCFGCYFGAEEYGLFAGQNTSEGNLADYKTGQFDSNKIFLFGENNFNDGEPLKGFYIYKGNYTYTTILGVVKTVPSFIKIDIPAELIKYIDIINDY